MSSTKIILSTIIIVTLGGFYVFTLTHKTLDQNVPAVVPDTSYKPASQNNTYTYYEQLASECTETQSKSCCLASVATMETGGYERISDTGCAEGYEVQTLKCTGGFRWCEPIKPPVSENDQWVAFENARYTFTFMYPALWNIKISEPPRLLTLVDQQNNTNVTIDTGVPAEVIGPSYCNAHQDEPRCESITTNAGADVTIDWDTSGNAYAILYAENGMHGISFTLHNVNSNTRDIFKQMLSTVSFKKE